MSLLQTLKAEVISACTYNISLLHGWILNCILATRSGAPFGSLVNVNEGFLEVVLIFLIELFCAELFEKCLWNDQFAPTLRTGSVDRVWPNSYLAVQILSVALEAKLVPALHPNGLSALAVAYRAEKITLIRNLHGVHIILKQLAQEVFILVVSVDQILLVPLKFEQQTTGNCLC